MMEKDTDSLVSVSPKFTEQTLQEILIKLIGNRNAIVSAWNVAPAATKGSNYLSVVHRVTINGIANGEAVQCQVVVKALTRNKKCNEILRTKDYFGNETAFYTKVVPLFEEFLESKNKGELLNIPRCLAYVQDGENDYLVLEDTKVMGFEHLQRQKAWKVEDCQAVFKALAQFHGIGLAVWHQNPSGFLNATKYLTEVLFTDKFWEWYERLYTSAIDIAKDAIMKEYGGTPHAEKFNLISAHELFKKCVELHEKPDKPILLVNHGDSWGTNFMLRTLSSGVKEAVIFDFQLARCASPVHDVAYFIYTATDKETRENHFQYLLKYYHSELAETMAALGSDIDEIYPWTLFMKEVKKQFVFGFAFALETLPASLLPESEAFEHDEVDERENIDIADIWKLTPIVDEVNRKRVADVVMHGIDQGFI